MIMGTALSLQAMGVTASTAEQSTKQDWFDRHFSAQNVPAFSFTYDGKSSWEFLKNWNLTEKTKKLSGNRTLKTLTYTDKETGLKVVCEATSFGSSSLEWVVTLENTGKQPTPLIENFLAMDTVHDLSRSQACIVHHQLGDYNSGDSFKPIDDSMKIGDKIVLAPNGGKSSDPHLPFLNLELGKGNGIAIAIGWSGQWQADFERYSRGELAVKIGQQQTHFKLSPGETFRSPRMVLAFWEGSNSTRGSNLMRQEMLRNYLVKRGNKPVVAPMCCCVGYADPDGTYEKPHLEAIAEYAKLGVEVFWSDMDPQHWYPVGFYNGTGNYSVDKAKYPHGLEPLGDLCKKLGIQYLLWFEPERVAPGTETDRDHPDFLFRPESQWNRLFNLGDPKALAWMIDNLDGFVKRLHLSWMRWDFNCDPLPFWRTADAPDRQGIAENHYITGLYKLWDELIKRNPGLVIDLCAGGGRRIDIEALHRGVPLWHSDMQCEGPKEAADQLQNAGLFRWVPYHGCGNFGFEPDYKFRSAMTSGNILAFDLRKEIAKDRVAFVKSIKLTQAIFKKVRPFMVGDYYTLFAHDGAETAWFGYQFHRPDLDAGCVIVFRRSKATETSNTLKLNDIKEEATYEVENQDTGKKLKMSGRELKSYRLGISEMPGSAILFYKRVSL
jgi:alpha-galactosidase